MSIGALKSFFLGGGGIFFKFSIIRVDLRPFHLSHSYSLQSNITRTESSWSVIPLILGYRLPTPDVPLSGFPNCLRRRVTATLDSQCNHWNCLLLSRYVSLELSVTNYSKFILQPMVSRQLLGIGTPLGFMIRF
jgi:hypothetical protein